LRPATRRCSALDRPGTKLVDKSAADTSGGSRPGFPDTIMFGDPAALAAAAPGLSYLLVAKPTVTTSPRQ